MIIRFRKIPDGCILYLPAVRFLRVINNMSGGCDKGTAECPSETKTTNMSKEEKKVEYLELIYDLVFVYIVGRNNSLLMNIEGGFVKGTTFLAYILSSLAVIQIWNFTTFYINMHGRNSVRDHISLFLNMYLLYYIGEGTRLHWETFQIQYHIAWALILCNIGMQYAIEWRNHRGYPKIQRSIRNMMIVLFGEAFLVLLALPAYRIAGLMFTPVPILYGIIMTRKSADDTKAELVDFTHLSERAMLYVVFTFGEMIVTIAAYFEGRFTWNSVYFSTMSFLIVTGLFLSYEVLYDHIIDRNRRTTGIDYIVIHLFLIFGLNNITTSLVFMRNEQVSIWPKIIFLTGSFMMYYICLFALMLFAKEENGLCMKFLGPIGVMTAVFVPAMLLLRENMSVNIMISVLYVYAVFFMIFRYAGIRCRN